jgi:hypothetical protein
MGVSSVRLSLCRGRQTATDNAMRYSRSTAARYAARAPAQAVSSASIRGQVPGAPTAPSTRREPSS